MCVRQIKSYLHGNLYKRLRVSGNSVLSATRLLHSPIVYARCDSLKYANASSGWWCHISMVPPQFLKSLYNCVVSVKCCRGLVKSDFMVYLICKFELTWHTMYVSPNSTYYNEKKAWSFEAVVGHPTFKSGHEFNSPKVQELPSYGEIPVFS